MSDINDENLPSIEDYSDSSDDLPSISDFLTEEELPSIQEFTSPEVIEEDNQTIDDAEGNAFLEVTDVVKAPEWSELVRLVNNVRESIPDIPEIKYYDKELEALEEEINRVRAEIPKHEIEAIYEQIDSVRTEINQNAADIPEIKYYDEQVENIENKIDFIQQEITNLPEPKYYEEELQTIKEELQVIRDEIPTFPKWVNQVNEVPDFSWIGKTFSVIDDDFIKVGDNIKSIKNRIDREVNELSETIETKEFESKVDIKKLNEDLVDTKDKIYKELKEAAIRIWDHHDQFKDDDRKLKKNVLSKLNETKQNIEKEIDVFKEKNHHENKLLTTYFEGLKEEIDNLPEVKYYDNPIKDLKKDLSVIDKRIEEKSLNISELYKIVEELRSVQEGLLNIPPNEEQSVGPYKDPLTPLDQKFATLADLQQHYKLFVNRVSQQLATFGGGGAVELQYLDDIVGIATNISAYDGMYLKVDTSQSSGHKFKFSTVSAGAGGTWASNSIGVSTTKNVGIATTARADYALYVQGDAYYTGNISAAGTITYEDVTNVDSVGIVTAGKGVRVTTGGLVVTAGVSTFSSDVVFVGDINQVNSTGIISATGLDIGTAGVDIDGQLDVDELVVAGVSTFSSAVDINAGLDVDGQADLDELVVAGVATFSNTVDINGVLDIDGQLDVDELVVAGVSTFSSLVDVNNRIDVVGGANIDQLNVTGVSTFSSAVDINAGLDVDGQADLDELVVAGVATFSSALDINATVDIDGQLDVDELIVAGVSTYSSELDINAGLTANNINVTGVSTFNNTIVGGATTELVVGGDLRVTGILTVGTESITIDGSNNILNVGAGITLNATTGKIEAPEIVTSGTTGAFYPPVMTTTQRDALTVTQGAMIYNSTDSKVQFYNGSSWIDATGVSLGLGMGVF